MNKLHLGELTGPLLIFGGPYSNLQATEALKKVAEYHSIAPQNCICTGDIVAYCAQPKETVDFVRDWGMHCLMGNCEESFANDADDCGCGFEEGTSCDLLSAQWFQFANQALLADQRAWFAGLPKNITFDYYGKHCHVIHGSVSSINQFIFESTDTHIFEDECSLSDANIIIGGHCGIPFTREINTTHSRQYWHNAGAIGMPANDGTTRTWFSLIHPPLKLETHSNISLSIETQALIYDEHGTYQKMLDANMNNGYANALTTGIWPSTDVLPEKEKQQQGIALQPTIVTITFED